MIKNERQFQISTKLAERMRAALDSLETKPVDPQLHHDLRELEMSALSAELAQIESELGDFQMLIESPPSRIIVNSLRDLPQSLIQARIARGLTHRDLASILGLKEQVIQRYEATDYRSVSFRRLIEIAEALGVEVHQELRLRDQTSASALIKRLRDVGVQTGLLERRFLRPGDVVSKLDSGCTVRLIDDLRRVFGWSEQELHSSEPLVLHSDHQVAASFKRPQNSKEDANLAYVMYAHYIALQISGLLKTGFRRPPSNWIELHEGLLASGNLNLRAVVNYSWDMGIAVIPLQDRIAIHGAFWNLGDRAAIILKQGMRTSSRWLIDLLHELYHAATEDSGIVESGQGLEDDAEDRANRFAVDVALGGRSEELIQLAVTDARGNMSYLKRSVQAVAERESVPVGLLANAMAWRLAPDHDWWGVAVNLQRGEVDPWEICRDVMLERVDLSGLPRPDQELVLAAFRDDRNHNYV